MGCDIHGAIEAKGDDRWRYVGDIGLLTGRNYDLFGFLWDVRNYGQFDPQFPNRGFPNDMSVQTESKAKDRIPDDAELEDELGRGNFHSASWATMKELHSIDWDQRSVGLDSRISILDENKEPTGNKVGSFGPASNWYEILQQGDNQERLDRGEPIPNEDGSKYIQRRELVARDTLSEAWESIIFDIMPEVEHRFGESRMVVWFDS